MKHKKSGNPFIYWISACFYGVEGGTRTHDIQNHKRNILHV